MSLGLGIHGEPGISEHPMPTASELAELLVSRLLEDKPDDAGDRVVAIVNGLGTVKYDELFLLFGKIEKLLNAAGLTVVEPECGELVTSLDMSGLSLTLFWLDDELEQYWAAPADTPAFRKGNLAPRRPPRTAGPEDDGGRGTEQTTRRRADLGRLAAAVLGQVRDVVVEHEDELGDLDAIAGDGDHGIGMRRGVDAAVAAARAERAAGASVGRVLDRGRRSVERTRRRHLGRAVGLRGHRRRPRAGQPGRYSGGDATAAAVNAFADAITELGKAEPGDKTMVDALLPFRDTFRTRSTADASARRCPRRRGCRGDRGSRPDRRLRPLKGRARPLAEKSLGHPDPGAVSFGLIAARVAATCVGSGYAGDPGAAYFTSSACRAGRVDTATRASIERASTPPVDASSAPRSAPTLRGAAEAASTKPFIAEIVDPLTLQPVPDGEQAS